MYLNIFICELNGTFLWNKVQFLITVLVSRLFICCDATFAEVLRLVVMLKAKYFCVITFLLFIHIKAKVRYDIDEDCHVFFLCV